MDVLYQTATWLIALPDSLLGMVLSICALLLALVWSRRRRRRISIKVTCSDWAVLAYVISQCVTLLITQLPSNTVHFILPYIFSLNMYMVVRLVGQYPLCSTNAAVGVMLAAAVLIGLSNLGLQLPSIRAAGLLFRPEALSGIRASLPIIGGPTRNDGLALVLCLLPFTYVAATQRLSGTVSRIVGVVAAGILTAVLTVGFSRSIYISLALFVAGCVALAVCVRRGFGKHILAVLMVSGMIVAMATYWMKSGRAVADTFLGDRTSQHRSTVGRAAIWHEVIDDVYKHPLLGYGGGVNGLMTLRRLRTHDEPFTAQVYNACLSVLLNSGLVGTAFYAIMLGYPLLSTFRAFRIQNNNGPLSNTRAILALGVFVLIVRDMTYSSLVDSGAVICVAWTSVALLVNMGDRRYVSKDPQTTLSLHHLSWAALVIPVILALPLVRTVGGEAAYYSGCNSLVHGNYVTAHDEFRKAIRWNSRQPMFYVADSLTLVRQMLDGQTDTNPLLRPAGNRQTQAYLLQDARHDLEQALRLSNDDASFWCDLAWVERLQGDDSDAAVSLKQALQRDPHDPVALISNAMLSVADVSGEQTIDAYAAAVSVYPRLLDSPLFQKLHSEHPDLAEQIIQRAHGLLIEESDSPILDGYLGTLYSYQGDYTRARLELRQAVDRLPDLPNAWANIGVLDLAEKNPIRAREDFARALYLDPGNRLAANLLAELDYEDGDIDRAESLYAEALLLPEESPHAARIWRLYYVRPPIANDLIPAALLPYISPGVNSIMLCEPTWLHQIGDGDGYSADAAERVKYQLELCK